MICLICDMADGVPLRRPAWRWNNVLFVNVVTLELLQLVTDEAVSIKVLVGIILPWSLVLLSLCHARIFYPRQRTRNVTFLLPQFMHQKNDSRSFSYKCKPSAFPMSGLHCFLDVSPHTDVSPSLHSSPLYLRGVPPVLTVVWSSLARLWLVIWLPKFWKWPPPWDISPSPPSPYTGKEGHIHHFSPLPNAGKERTSYRWLEHKSRFARNFVYVEPELCRTVLQ